MDADCDDLRIIQPGERFETVEGMVRGLGLHDELAGTMYAVVQRIGAARATCR